MAPFGFLRHKRIYVCNLHSITVQVLRLPTGPMCGLAVASLMSAGMHGKVSIATVIRVPGPLDL